MEVVAKSGDLEDVFQVLKMHVDEVILQFREDSLRIQAADASATMMVDIEFNKGFFDKYDREFEKHEESYANGETLMVGVHTENLYEILKTFKSDEELTLSLEDSRIKISSEDADLELPVLNLHPDDHIVETDRIELNSHVEIEADEFINQVGKVELMDAPIEVTFYQHKVMLEVESQTASGKVAIKPESFDGEQGVTSLYDEKKMASVKSTIKKLYSRDGLVNFSIAEESPFKLSFSDENLKIKIFTAPRIRE